MLGHMVSVSLNLFKKKQKPAKLFSKVPVPPCIPGNEDSGCSTYLPVLVIFCLFNFSHLSVFVVCVLMVLICICLISNNVKHLSICHLYISFGEMSIIQISCTFLLGCLFSYY